MVVSRSFFILDKGDDNMRVVRKINNCAALCVDDNGRELIAFGKGIGFGQLPYDLEDLSIITRTFYGIQDTYMNLIEEIPEDIFLIASDVTNYARMQMQIEVDSNVIFTLADHINFALQRYEQGIILDLPLYHDIKHLYTKEVEVGKLALKLIEKRLHVKLPPNEIYSISMQFIDGYHRTKAFAQEKEASFDDIMKHIIDIIEARCHTTIDQDGFNYARFVTHMQYLLKRKEQEMMISSENKQMFETVKEKYPETYQCVLEVDQCLKKQYAWKSNEEELLYLMIHINRLCAREDCYR